ncbi:MAG: hypothetical protein IID45_13505, partial [Planctomycetes bacterium]|nr:hypothetical protein [Planctomycetota bacterium]
MSDRDHRQLARDPNPAARIRVVAAVVLCAAIFIPAGCARRIRVVSPSSWGGQLQPVEGWAWKPKPVSDPFVDGTRVQMASGRQTQGRDTTFADLTSTPAVETVVVPGNRRWVNTGFHLSAGDAVTVVATGRVRVFPADRKESESETEPGPTGTYLYPDAVADKPFPLPTAMGGPAPAFCLIGRIGEGTPFYVGARRSWQVERGGVLHLGINDFDTTDNSGSFTVKIARTAAVQPVVYEETLLKRPPDGKPEPGCSLVIFYIDGLRPDVVREMA